MKILVHDYSGHPFQVQLSRELAKRGHDVTHLYAAFFQTPHGALDRTPDDPDSFNIEALDLGELFEKHRFVKRRKQEIRYGALCAQKISEMCPEIVISANAPLDAQNTIVRCCNALSIPFVFWVQDLYSIAMHRILSKKWPLLGDAIGRYYEHMEKVLLQRSDGVVAITEDFLPNLERWRVNRKNISVIPNWAPIEQIPVLNKKNDWAVAHQLADGFNFVYTGTLGMKHNPELLIGLAERMRDHKDVNIVVLSEGPGAENIDSESKARGLKNIRVLGFQPFDVYPSVLGAADVLIAVLEKDAGVFSVPSKVLSYLCAQKPLLLAVPAQNLASKIVMQNHCGLVVEPDDVGGFVASAEQLLNDAQLREDMGRNAREYAEKHFDIHAITDRFEKTIKSLTKERES